MAITTTTLAAALSTTSDQTIKVTSATGFKKGLLVAVDDEIMKVTEVTGVWIGVTRGYRGSVAKTHASGAPVGVGSPNEFTQPTFTIVAKSLTGSAGATASKGYLVVIVDGTLRYIPLTDSVS
jgi:hypothetical protein